ncbi:MAG: iron ABC transporter permease [Proteobacteria bacterium]|nr:iron ABC transporter permease [Pseudomonadota bacterium]
MRALVLALVLAGLVGLLALASLGVGPVPLGPGGVIAGLFDASGSPAAMIVQEIRLPRTLLAILVGASLGLSGAALQGLLLNPLAEPGVVGVSASAAFGAVIAFYFGLASLHPLALPVGGMAGALAAGAALRALAGAEGSALALILAGVAVNALAAALTALALNLAPSPYAALEIVFWMMGSLADRSLVHVGLAAALMAPGWVLIASAARGLDALALGPEAARSLGVGLALLNWRVVAGTALAVGAAVSFTGGIAFVGLVVPHLLRPLVGHRPGRLLMPSALGGAALLLAADLAVRLIPTAAELKIGVLTALIGAPFFLRLILGARRTLP